MTIDWTEALALLGVQHFWLSAMFFALAAVTFRLHWLRAATRSRILLGLLALAAFSPLAIFLPAGSGSAVVAASAHGAAEQPRAVQNAGIADEHAAASDAKTSASERTAAIPSSLKALAIVIWLLGFVWGLHRLLLGGHEARRLLDTAIDDPRLQQLMAREFGADASIRRSDQIVGPMVVGLKRPCILVPARLVGELPEPALLEILRHELAHIRRRDLWIALSQRICLAFWWWNPFLRVLGSRLDLAREMACDEQAAQSSTGSRSYARALLASAEMLVPHDRCPPALAVGGLGSRRELAERIDALLRLDDAPPASLRIGGLVVLCMLTMVSAAVALAATPRLESVGDPQAQADQVEALLEAAKAGRMEDVRSLVQRGVAVDARLEGDRPAGTALIQAAKAGNLVMVNELIRLGADVNQASRRDGNPLIMAAMNGRFDVVRRLIESGADVNAIVPFDETPLINAAREGHLAIVMYLVEHGADVNLGLLADEDRWRSPLNQAHGEAVRDYLIAHGAVPRVPRKLHDDQ